MTVVGISMVRDEADIIGDILGHMVAQVDHVIVADNLSVDGTRDVLEAFDVTIVDDPDPAYYQSAKMTALARRAATEFNADWIIPFDADEWWTHPNGRLADVLEASECDVMSAAVYDHVIVGDAAGVGVDSMPYRWKQPSHLPKVATRPLPGLIIDQGNHGVSCEHQPVMGDGLMIHHFPVRSFQQFARKVDTGYAAYQLADLPIHFGEHWKAAGAVDLDGKRAIFNRLHTLEQPDSRVVLDPVR